MIHAHITCITPWLHAYILKSKLKNEYVTKAHRKGDQVQLFSDTNTTCQIENIILKDQEDKDVRH